jgi:phosphonate transport system substrate-binding protein
VTVVRGVACRAAVCLLLLLGAAPPSGAAAPPTAATAPIRFGYPAIEDPTITLGKYQRLLDAMAAAIGRPVSLILRDSYAEIVRDFEKAEVDVGILNAFSYVEIAARAQLAPLARRVRAGRDTYQSYLVVREEGDITRYEALRGRVIAFPDSRSTTGYLLPRLMLRGHRLEPTRDFARVLFVGRHDSTALAVANGTADVGALASYIYEELEPVVQGKLRILDRSEPIPLGPVVARTSLGAPLLARIRLFFVTLGESREGQTLLRDARLSGFTGASDVDYAPIRSLVRRLQ